MSALPRSGSQAAAHSATLAFVDMQIPSCPRAVVLRLQLLSPMEEEDAHRALIAAVADWCEMTGEGKDAAQSAGGAVSISTLAEGDCSSRPLQRNLRKHGIESIEIAAAFDILAARDARAPLIKNSNH